jgi:predicted ATPase
MLGYLEVALADANQALNDAREIGQAATLMYALGVIPTVLTQCGDYAAASTLLDELASLAEQKGAPLWKAMATVKRGALFAASGDAVTAVQLIDSGVNAWRSTKATVWLPIFLSHLARANAELGEFDKAWHCISEAMATIETSKEIWWEPEIHRVAGEIALKSGYFDRALAIARQQQAKSFELRASMSLARLWRDQGKVQQARELLAPVYGWFTEGFDTRDLKEAKALLEELAV